MAMIDPQTAARRLELPDPDSLRAGRIAELPDACRTLGIGRPLLITDPGLAEHALGQRVLKIARDAGLGCGLFAQIRPNPTGADVERGVEALRAGGHYGVIALGGGSGLDAAKAIAFMAGQTCRSGTSRTSATTGCARAPRASCRGRIPTTAGTGSEVGRVAVITNADSHLKCIVFHPRMLPGQVIADPELTLGLPRNLTAWTGFDALSHNLEALCAPGFHPLADGIATEGIRLIHQWLKAAARDGANLAARAYMLAAASMGAIAFQKGLGAMHALAHPIGGLLDSHHGLTIAIVMPYVLARNRQAIEARLGQLERTLGLERGGFPVWVAAMREELEIPPTLEALGMRAEHVAVLAPRAAADPSAAGNPIALDEAGYAALYRRALAG